MNHVFLVGRLGDNPKNFAKEGEKSIVGFSIATNEVYTDKAGNKIESTEWHNVIAFGGRGDSILKYLQKGDKVCVNGKIQYKKFLKSNGEESVATQIVVENFEFTPKKQ